MAKVRQAARLIESSLIPGDWFCTTCGCQAPEEEFIVVGSSPQCPDPDCKSDDVFDAWENPTEWGFSARLEHPPGPGTFFCRTCGKLGEERSFIAKGSAWRDHWCPQCGESVDLVDAAEAWQEQVREFGERGVVYDPEKGWCNST